MAQRKRNKELRWRKSWQVGVEESGKETDKELMFNLMVHSTNGCNSQIWVRSKPEAGNSLCMPYMNCRDPSTSAFFCAFQGPLAGNWIKAKHLGLKNWHYTVRQRYPTRQPNLQYRYTDPMSLTEILAGVFICSLEAEECIRNHKSHDLFAVHVINKAQAVFLVIKSENNSSGITTKN